MPTRNSTCHLSIRLLFFKNLNVGFQWDLYRGNSIYNLTRQWLYGTGYTRILTTKLQWMDRRVPMLDYYASLYNSVQRTGWFVEDGSFLRLRDVTLTYQFGNILKSKWMKNLALTMSGRNLVTFTCTIPVSIPKLHRPQDSQGNRTFWCRLQYRC